MSPNAKREPRSRPVLTERDRIVLVFLSEQRVAATTQLAALLEVSDRTAISRAERLERLGVAELQRIFAGQPPAVWINGSGLKAIGSPLPPPEPRLQELRHDLGVGWLWLAARRGAFGPLRAVVCEREMRSHDGRPGNEESAEKHGIGIWQTSSARSRRGPGSDRHYPDLVLETRSGRKLAIELELTGKSDVRLAGIMSAYAIDRRYARVLYLVPDRRSGERIRSAALAAGAQDIVGVQLVDAAAISGAGPVLARSRGRGHHLLGHRARGDRHAAADAGLEPAR